MYEETLGLNLNHAIVEPPLVWVCQIVSVCAVMEVLDLQREIILVLVIQLNMVPCEAITAHSSSMLEVLN